MVNDRKPPVRQAGVSQTKSQRANLKFPVGRISKLLKNRRYSERVGVGASIYLASVLENTITDILETSLYYMKKKKKSRIIPRDIFFAIKEDELFSELLKNSIIFESGVIPEKLRIQ